MGSSFVDQFIKQCKRSEELVDCLKDILFNIQINNMDSFLRSNIKTSIESVLTETEIQEVNNRF
jgi:hypothetical protein